MSLLLKSLTLSNDLLTVYKVARQFEFNSLQQAVNCEPNLFSVSPPAAVERRGALDAGDLFVVYGMVVGQNRTAPI